ncbi:Exoribonuclease R [Geodermatophilus dictyosporus]|uniref:Exoribonuclease R n=1 Tax=Geodermatophilus dictyosporus TaxID=1523247 RepID=A0A1I5SCM2_9ACTN|nr:RNB domain-containing ribonuclease [Geodermatophilus dictyosporus]SFP68459.1 Exoribonuclease R [Geodermatophilus dictyosporus]
MSSTWNPVLPRWPDDAPPGPDFAGIRAEFDVPEDFPPEALAEAARPPVLPDEDATDVELVTVDPPGSRDLDQAVHLQRDGDGWLVRYAIADVGAVARPGGALDTEARRRGQTLYSPDRRTPLYPPELSEGAASLLAGQERAAVLWTVRLDADGSVRAVDVRRARVRSRAQLAYPDVQARADAGTLPEPIALLPELGRLLERAAAARGAIELGTPEQQVVRTEAGGWTLVARSDLPVERWNAQVSLLTGRVAAGLMLGAGVGLLRTLPPARPEDVARLRRLAPALGVEWSAGAGAGEVLAGLDGADPRHAAFREEAATLLRGAAYTAFDGTPPEQTGHAGVGAPYAHVTAPLRRLVDRFATEVCLALADGREPDPAVRAALPDLPAAMAASDRRTRAVERAAVDATEAWLLAGRTGEEFDAVVVDVEDDRGTVVIAEPAIRARCGGTGLEPGSRVRVRLVEADVARRSVRFTVVGD